MKFRDIKVKEVMQISEDPEKVKDSSNRINRILDAKYIPANLKELVKNRKGLDKE